MHLYNYFLNKFNLTNYKFILTHYTVHTEDWTTEKKKVYKDKLLIYGSLKL